MEDNNDELIGTLVFQGTRPEVVETKGGGYALDYEPNERHISIMLDKEKKPTVYRNDIEVAHPIIETLMAIGIDVVGMAANVVASDICEYLFASALYIRDFNPETNRVPKPSLWDKMIMKVGSFGIGMAVGTCVTNALCQRDRLTIELTNEATKRMERERLEKALDDEADTGEQEKQQFFLYENPDKEK